MNALRPLLKRCHARGDGRRRASTDHSRHSQNQRHCRQAAPTHRTPGTEHFITPRTCAAIIIRPALTRKGCIATGRASRCPPPTTIVRLSTDHKGFHAHRYARHRISQGLSTLSLRDSRGRAAFRARSRMHTGYRHFTVATQARSAGRCRARARWRRVGTGIASRQRPGLAHPALSARRASAPRSWTAGGVHPGNHQPLPPRCQFDVDGLVCVWRQFLYAMRGRRLPSYYLVCGPA
ncbi:aminopeptidase N domain protein [Bordetella holmesii 70147]|nr:aminopeptidase N domain protein [Bordetella holmesii 70147]